MVLGIRAGNPLRRGTPLYRLYGSNSVSVREPQWGTEVCRHHHATLRPFQPHSGVARTGLSWRSQKQGTGRFETARCQGSDPGVDGVEFVDL